MELVVGADVLGLVFRIHGVHGLQVLAQFSARLVGNVARRQAGRHALEPVADLVGSHGFLEAEAPDPYAAVGLDLQEAFLRELPDGLADRRAGHSQRLGEFLLAQPLAGF